MQAYLRSFEDGDPDAVAAWVTDDFFNEHTSALAESLSGRDAYRDRLGRFLREFDGVRYEPELVIADGPHVAVPYRMTATWVSPAGDRHPFTIRGMFRFIVRDGRIAHRVDYWDSKDFERQVGRDEA